MCSASFSIFQKIAREDSFRIRSFWYLDLMEHHSLSFLSNTLKLSDTIHFHSYVMKQPFLGFFKSLVINYAHLILHMPRRCLTLFCGTNYLTIDLRMYASTLVQSTSSNCIPHWRKSESSRMWFRLSKKYWTMVTTTTELMKNEPQKNWIKVTTWRTLRRHVCVASLRL